MNVNVEGIEHVSHEVEVSRHEGFKREQLYLELACTIVARPLVVTMSADRYVSSSGLGSWRLYVKQIENNDGADRWARSPAAGIGPAKREALGEACEPVAQKWLESDDFLASRRVGFAYALKRHVAEERYRPDAVVELVRRYKAELELSDYDNLVLALRHLQAQLDTLEKVPA